MTDRCRVMCSDDAYSSWRCDNPMPCPDHAYFHKAVEPSREGKLSGMVERVSRVQATIYDQVAAGGPPRPIAIDLWMEDGELRMREYDAVQGRGSSSEFYDYVIPRDVLLEMEVLVDEAS